MSKTPDLLKNCAGLAVCASAPFTLLRKSSRRSTAGGQFWRFGTAFDSSLLG
jgi:hypothetical protein